VCDEDSGNMTDFIHFHISAENLKNSEYFLAFIERADLQDKTACLAVELEKSITWLEVRANKVFLNVFTYGAPAFNTGNTSFLDYALNKNRLKAECDIVHISKDFENRLTISLKNNALAFQPS
jgi:hypothetical protein